jgi:predicted RNA binding protein YcfA (HicA-like mRNA interferase family)/uncharacterized protein YukE
MTITPADSLDLLIARGPPDATDFAKQIAGLPGAYYAGLDEAYKRRTQDAFQNLDPSKPVDLQNLYKTLLIQGGVPQGAEVAKGLQEQSKQDLLSSIARKAFPDTSGQPPEIPGAPPSTAGASNATSPSLLPPTARISVQPASYSTGTTVAGEAITPSIRSLIPSGMNERAATNLGASIAARLPGLPPGTALDDPLPPQLYAQAQQMAQQAAAVPGRVAQAPSTLAPVQDPAEAARRATLAAKRDRFYGLAAAVEALDPKRAATYRAVAEAADKELQPTEAEKNARGDKLPGESQADYEARQAGLKESATKFAGIATEMFDKASKNADAAQAAKYRLDLIDHSILELGPKWMGSGAATRFEIAKGVNTALDNILPKDLADRVKFDPKKIANVEDFNKQTQTLGFELAKTLGSREAMQIVQQATNSVPNFAQSELGAKLVSSSLRQAAQREEDHFAYIADHKGDLKATLNFNKQNPPEMYSTRAIAASGIPLKLNPGDEKKVGYLLPGTKYMWNGKPWTKN